MLCPSPDTRIECTVQLALETSDSCAPCRFPSSKTQVSSSRAHLHLLSRRLPGFPAGEPTTGNSTMRHTADRHVSEEGTEGGEEIIALVAHYAHYWVFGLISPMLYVRHEWTFFHRYIHNIFPLIQNEFPLLRCPFQ